MQFRSIIGPILMVECVWSPVSNAGATFSAESYLLKPKTFVWCQQSLWTWAVVFLSTTVPLGNLSFYCSLTVWPAKPWFRNSSPPPIGASDCRADLRPLQCAGAPANPRDFIWFCTESERQEKSFKRIFSLMFIYSRSHIGITINLRLV